MAKNLQAKEFSAGERLYLARCAVGLTQLQVAQYVGCTQAAIHYWENDKSLPPVAILASLSILLKRPILELLPAKYRGYDETRQAAQDVRAASQTLRDTTERLRQRARALMGTTEHLFDTAQTLIETHTNGRVRFPSEITA